MSLRDELAALPPAIAAAFAAHGFGADWLIARAETIGRSNRVDADVAPPGPLSPAAPTAAHVALGEQLLARGEVAFCVLAGGMATRMGNVVKALVEIAPGLHFLEARRREQAAILRRLGTAPWLWLMVSEATRAPIQAALGADAAHVATFDQNVSLRLDPSGALFRTATGEPSLHATGHGDVIDGLRRSGLLPRFVAGGGRFVFVTNLDNLGATLDPGLLGWFAAQQTPLLVELCDKAPGDRGGIPVDVAGRIQVLEEFRLPRSFDPTTVGVFNTNTMWLDARALQGVEHPWSWFSVEKQVDDRPAVQFERLLGELTAALPTRYVVVPRDGTASRFLPVKDRAELDARRDAILTVLRARGIL